MSGCYKILSVKKLRRYGFGEKKILHYQMILEGLEQGHNIVTLPWYQIRIQAPKVGKYAYYGPNCYKPVLGIENLYKCYCDDYQWHVLNKMVTDKAVFTRIPGELDFPEFYSWQILKANGTLEQVR